MSILSSKVVPSPAPQPPSPPKLTFPCLLINGDGAITLATGPRGGVVLVVGAGDDPDGVGRVWPDTGGLWESVLPVFHPVTEPLTITFTP